MRFASALCLVLFCGGASACVAADRVPGWDASAVAQPVASGLSFLGGVGDWLGDLFSKGKAEIGELRAVAGGEAAPEMRNWGDKAAAARKTIQAEITNARSRFKNLDVEIANAKNQSPRGAWAGTRQWFWVHYLEVKQGALEFEGQVRGFALGVWKAVWGELPDLFPKGE